MTLSESIARALQVRADVPLTLRLNPADVGRVLQVLSLPDDVRIVPADEQAKGTFQISPDGTFHA